MKLEVSIAFHDKFDTSIEYKEGQVVEFDDIDRVNDLVHRGLCKIVDEQHLDALNRGGKVVVFRDVEYGLDVVKSALAEIGVSVAPNSKEKGVANIIDKLSGEQSEALFDALNRGEEE